MTLRTASDADTPFLAALYASTREDERLRFGWTEEMWRTFIARQFSARQASYRAEYPASEDHIVVVDGRDAGRLMQCRLGDEIRLIDIALLPAWQGQGIGTALITAMLNAAFAGGLAVRLHVDKANRARRLYERLGFVLVADVGMHVLLERRPPELVS